MRTKVLLVVAALLMAIVSTVAIGSNMGFKISIPLTAGWNNYVSLPFYSSYSFAHDVFDDIVGCQFVNRWDNTTGTVITWDNDRGDDFSLTPGEAIWINVSSSTSWIVVGSHNPGLALDLKSGWNNYVSVPYHTTATTASGLFSTIPGCQFINRWDNATGTVITWDNDRGDDFTLTPGEGIWINVASDTPWTPAHY